MASSVNPEYDRTYIYKSPTNQYQNFCNAFSYSRMLNTENPKYPKPNLVVECNEEWKKVRNKPKKEIEDIIDEYLKTTILNSSLPKLIDEIVIIDTLPPNAVAQRQAANAINNANQKLAECQRMYNTTTDLEIRKNLLEHIATLKQILNLENKRIIKLKRQADYTRKSAEKKAKRLHEQQIVERYNSPGKVCKVNILSTIMHCP